MTRVLLVDDEPELLEAWSFALEYVGYDVERARDGRQALAAIERQPPDLLITDLMMPGMNGEDLCRALRSDPRWAEIPILLHTSAYIGANDGAALWNAVLRKPARIEDFLATVAKLTQG
ncbi:response regulator [Paraburkholderia phymatum]|uniref:Response regulator receiver protein n=1 Tax=Paraburkholderia phymatum (strain DSM 17167 / CIP 108236 / LMG 21445 / STM815) TaxID=391038 RepID=B2JRX5_PARP8|nr:response regulator [Paraburkholderia phymatum]ACC73894.1 response regulator receiver protein [Paraburkholderia phymatum STM815]